MRIALLLAAILLAGCATPDPETAATPTPTPGIAMKPVTTTIPVTLAAALPANEPRETSSGTFDVPDGANVTLIEARWTCSSPTCDFNILILDEGGEIVEVSDMGANAVSLEVSLDAGTYTAWLRSAGPAANMEGEIRATIFFGPMPDDFTAFDS